MKKAISILFALLLLTAFCAPAFAAEYTFVLDDLQTLSGLDAVNKEAQKLYEQYGLSFCYLKTDVPDREACNAKTDACFIQGETIPDAPAIILTDGGDRIYMTGLGGAGDYFPDGAVDAMMDAYDNASSEQEGILAYMQTGAGYLAATSAYTFVVDELGKINTAKLNAKAQELYDTYGISFCFMLTEAEDREACDEKIYETFIPGVTIPSAPALVLADVGENIYTAGLSGAANYFENGVADAVLQAYNEDETYEGGVTAFMETAVEYLIPDKEVVSGLWYMVDNASLLTGDEAQELNDKLAEISARQACDVVIVTVNGLGGKTPMDFADDYYDYNGYGQGPGSDGILFLVSMEERDWWFTTTGYGITAFTDYGQEQLFDAISSDLSGGYYYDAFDGFAEKCDELLTLAHNGTPLDVGSVKSPFYNAMHNNGGVIGIVLALVLGLLIAFIPMGKLKAQINNVKWQKTAGNYTKPGSMVLTQNYDHFLYANTTRRVIETESSSGSRGGSSTHTSSSGRSHGGSGGKF